MKLGKGSWSKLSVISAFSCAEGTVDPAALTVLDLAVFWGFGVSPGGPVDASIERTVSGEASSEVVGAESFRRSSGGGISPVCVAHEPSNTVSKTGKQSRARR